MADEEEKPTLDKENDDELDDDDAELPDDELADGFEEDFEAAEVEDEAEEAEDDDAEAGAKAAPAAGAEEEDEDEPDPDDVEEDLDTILKDKISSGDDLEEDEEEDDDETVAPPIQATEGDKVAPKGENEWTCTGCFLIVSARQFGKKETATCPSGVSNCPSLAML